MILSLVIFLSAVGYLVVTGNDYPAYAAFALAVMYDEEARLFASILSAAVMGLCLYHIYGDALFPSLTTDWQALAATWWLMILAFIRGYFTVN